jgi:SRSO17 transposase
MGVPDPAAATRSATQALVAPGQFKPFSRADQRQWGRVYLRGLLLDGRRKSVEPMAARLGEEGNRQALAHF